MSNQTSGDRSWTLSLSARDRDRNSKSNNPAKGMDQQQWASTARSVPSRSLNSRITVMHNSSMNSASELNTLLYTDRQMSQTLASAHSDHSPSTRCM